VFVTQSLGGTFTLQVPAYGGLFRIAGKDADALARHPRKQRRRRSAAAISRRWYGSTSRPGFDPEIPVNIVDLGLVYAMELTPQPDGTQKVDIKMTLTAQGCGMGATIAIDAKQKIMTIAGISEANVDIVWESAMESPD